MALIEMITPEKATGAVAETYAQMTQAFGSVPEPMQLWAVSPWVFGMFRQGIDYFTNHPTLSPMLGAWIRYLVASRDDCRFCIDFNAAMLLQGGATQADLEAAAKDASKATLEPKEKAILALVLKAVNTPKQVSAGDIAGVIALGYTERDVLDAVASGALMAMDDILLNTFKV